MPADTFGSHVNFQALVVQDEIFNGYATALTVNSWSDEQMNPVNMTMTGPKQKVGIEESYTMKLALRKQWNV